MRQPPARRLTRVELGAVPSWCEPLLAHVPYLRVRAWTRMAPSAGAVSQR